MCVVVTVWKKQILKNLLYIFLFGLLFFVRPSSERGLTVGLAHGLK